MTKRIPIRAKLAMALFVPVLAMFAVSVFEVTQANHQVDAVRQDTDLASAALGPGSLIRSLQDERNDSAVSAVGLRASAHLPTKDLAESRKVVDAAADAFRAELRSAGPEAEHVYAAALASFDKTTAKLRDQYDAATGKPSLARLPLSNEMWNGYSATITRFIEANTRLTLLIDDPELRSAAEMLDAVSRQVEYLGTMIRTGIFSSLGGSDVKGTTKADVIAGISAFEANRDRITLLATGSYTEPASKLADNSAYQKAVDLLDAYVDTDVLDTPGIISSVSQRPTPDVDTVAKAATKALNVRSADLRSDAEDRQRAFVGLSIGVLVVGGAFMLLAARSITRPLLSLTRQAEDMAGQRLPAAVQEILDTPLGDDVVIPDVAPVAVRTRDEVREVAVALNSVQTSALDLAVEQAVLRRNIADSFVNLGRRTQNLIGRQLDFITELERNETDPVALDNLFKLDHLATRARRNAESLVVLAGLVTPRTWTAPIAMADVVRAALSEVEDYQRVDVRTVGEATVPGRTAADLVHLLAELVENGLSFSPPGRPVEVHGRMTRNGYVLAIVDQGIGMTADELLVANDRLAGRESYTVAPSRYLGHYVAGSLASRIGVSVTLDESPTGGISAKIVLPASVLDEVPSLPPLAGAHPGAPAPAPAPAAQPLRTVDVASTLEAELATTATPRPVQPVATTDGGLRKRVRAVESVPAPVAPVAEPVAATPLAAVPVAATPLAAVPDVAPEPTPEPLPWAPAAPAPITMTVVANEAPEPAAAPAPAPAQAAWPAPAPRATPATAGWGVPAATPEAPAAFGNGNGHGGRAGDAPGTTTNGLRKRVPGDQLAASNLTPMIRRGTGGPPAGQDPPSDSAAADSMFSLLTSFESGVERGLSDLAATTPPTEPTGDDHHDREV